MKVMFVCSGNNPHFGPAPFIRAQAASLEAAGIAVEEYLIIGKGIGGYLKHIKPLRRKIQEGSFDLIHAHYTFSGWIARLAAPRKPLVISYMGSDTYGSVNLAGKPRLKSIPVIMQGALLSLLSGGVILKSENLKRFILRRKRVEIIPNGVNFKVFKPIGMQEARKVLDLDPEIPYILFAGNPEDARKNFAMARGAVNRCPTEPRPQLLAPYPVSHSQMPLWLNAVNLLIQTSWKEGSPNVIKEAIACNTPVLATPAGDTADLLSGIANCAVCPYDEKQLTQHLALIIETGKRSDGRQQRPDLDDRVIAQRIISLYHQVMNT